MTNTKSTKRALLSSVLALLVCVTMLIGTTFAWFTDSVTSAGNIIKSGTLEVTMEWLEGKVAPTDDAAWQDASKGAIFNSTLWEPGYTEVRHIKIENEGTLALKYQLHIVANGEVSELADVIDVYYIDPAEQITDRTQLKEENKIGTLTEVLANMGSEESTAMGNLEADEKHTVTLALKMQESAGNQYQDLAIGSDFSIMLFATQYTSESDSFDNTYDSGAELPVVAKAASQAELATAIKEGADTVYLAEGTYKLPGTTNNEITLIGNGDTVVDLSYATGQALSGTDVTLENLTVTGVNQDYAGLQHVGNVVYNNVVFNNSTNLYGESVTFNNCTFNLTSRYIWTYGAGVATFNNCTFNTAGKAILAYKESDPATYTVNINDCTFYATEAGYTGSGDHCAAVEIDSHLVGAYVINFNGTNTVSENFVGLYRIKSQKDPANTTVNQNGTVVTTDLVPVSDGLYTDSEGDYYVYNAAGLQSLKTWMDSHFNNAFWGKTYNIMADIDATNVEWKTKHISPDSSTFDGITFNGNGHTIKNLTISGPGLFNGATKGTASSVPAVFKDIIFDNATVNGGSHHNGVIWGEAYGDITVDNVQVINSNITGGCNVGALIGRNFDPSTIKFVDCVVKNTKVEATKVADYAGASAFLGMALTIGNTTTIDLIFEGNNVAEGNTLTTADGMQGGGIYTTAEWDTDTWEAPIVVDTFTNYNSAN